MVLPANSSQSTITTLSSVSPWDTQRRYSDLGDSCPARAKPGSQQQQQQSEAGPSAAAAAAVHHHHHHYHGRDAHAHARPADVIDYPAARSYSNLDAHVADSAQFHPEHYANFPPFDPAVDTPWLYDPPPSSDDSPWSYDPPPTAVHAPRPLHPHPAAPSAPAPWLFNTPAPPARPPGSADRAAGGEMLPHLVYESPSEDGTISANGSAHTGTGHESGRTKSRPSSSTTPSAPPQHIRPGARLHFHHHHHYDKPDSAHTGTSYSSSSSLQQSSTTERPRGYPRPLGHGNGFPVLARGRFLHAHSTTYHIHASPNKRYRVHDIADRDNQPLFRLIPTPLCLRETKTLVDLRQPRARAPAVLRAHTIVFTTRASVLVNDAHGHAVLFLQKTSFVQSKRVIRGYVGGADAKTEDRKPQLVIREEERGRSYAFNDAKANEIAHLQRYRLPAQHASAKRKYAYKLHVSGGYDCALFIMAAVLMLDIWDD